MAALRRQSSHIGRLGEEAASRFLENAGYELLCRNYRAPHGIGELDLVVRDDAGTLCFVEVKTRREKTGCEVHPAWAVDPAKQQHIRRASQAYLRALGKPVLPTRFDVIEIWSSPAGRPLRLRHWPNAFGPQKWR
ncbi:MAG: YraN family protein [Victivallales bacterium]|nr:YraN family protein [Victivallales bacterium]